MSRPKEEEKRAKRYASLLAALVAGGTYSCRGREGPPTLIGSCFDGQVSFRLPCHFGIYASHDWHIVQVAAADADRSVILSS